MSLRDKLNDNPRITTGITIALIVVVLGYILYNTMSGGPGGAPAPAPNLSFYTVDDGATWFADDATRIPPFEHKGKQAVRARVYKCDGKVFVNHLERFTPEAQKRMQALAARSAGGDAMPAETVGLEVKSPGGGDQWVAMTHPGAVKIMAPKCTGNLELVSP